MSQELISNMSVSVFKNKSVAYLDFGIFKYVAKVLRDSVFGTQILLRKVHRFLVREDSGRVRSEELLLDAHVVVGDGEDRGPIL